MRENLLSLKEIVQPSGLLPIGKSTWYAGIKSGLYPQKIKVGSKSYWLKKDIENIVMSVMDKSKSKRVN
jgi:prophage regulatory protein